MAQNIDYGNRNTFSALTGKLYSKVVRRSEIKTVALTGSYNDLTDKPAVPDGNLYVKKAGDTITGNIVPNSTATLDLGSVEKVFLNVYSQAFLSKRSGVGQGGLSLSVAGSTSTVGEFFSTLGNAVASGTVNNARGRVRMYGTGAGYTDLIPGNNSANNITLTLPSTGGTLALDSKFGSYVKKAGDTISGHLLPIQDHAIALGNTSLAYGTVYSRNFRSFFGGIEYGSLVALTEGTASTQGEAYLIVGNNIAPGAAGNARGRLRLYGKNTGFTEIHPGNHTTSDIILTLPSTAGTLALTSQIPTVPGVATTSANGLMSAADKTKLDAVANTYVKKAGDTISGNIVPNADLTINLGASGKAFVGVFAQNFSVSRNNVSQGSLVLTVVGTTSVAGETVLSVGNNKVSGTAGNARGRVNFYGTGAGVTELIPGNNSENNITLTLPSSGGTLALDSKFGSYVKKAGDTVSGHIVPNADNSVALGDSAKAFGSVYSSRIMVNRGGASYGNLLINTVGTTSAVGIGTLHLGNNIASGTAGNAKGRIVMFGTGVGYTDIYAGNNTADNVTITFPSSSGTLARTVDNVASATQVYLTNTNPASETYYNMPFQQSAGSGNVSLLSNNGIWYVTNEGTTSALGKGLLILGNGTASGNSGNKYGGIQLWGTDNHNWHIVANKAAGADYGLKLPKSSGCLVAVPTDGTAVGNSSTPVYVNANGQVVAGNTYLPSGEKSFNDADYKNKFVQLAFPYDNNNLSQISVARSTAGSGALVAHGPILAFKNGDTHGYLHMAYSDVRIRAGAGNAGKILWERSLVTSPVNGAVGSSSVPVYVDDWGRVVACTDISAGALDFAKDSNGNWGYIDPATKEVVPFNAPNAVSFALYEWTFVNCDGEHSPSTAYPSGSGFPAFSEVSGETYYYAEFLPGSPVGGKFKATWGISVSKACDCVVYLYVKKGKSLDFSCTLNGAQVFSRIEWGLSSESVMLELSLLSGTNVFEADFLNKNTGSFSSQALVHFAFPKVDVIG